MPFAYLPWTSQIKVDLHLYGYTKDFSVIFGPHTHMFQQIVGDKAIYDKFMIHWTSQYSTEDEAEGDVKQLFYSDLGPFSSRNVAAYLFTGKIDCLGWE